MLTKRIAAATFVLLILLSGCVKAPSTSSEPVQVRLCAHVSAEQQANVLRDQLKKIGIDLVVDLLPDGGTLMGALESGNYELMLGEISGSGSPDSAYRSIVTVGGDFNLFGINDPELEALMDKAAAETPEVYATTYADVERMICEEKVYVTTLYRTTYFYAFSGAIDISEDSIYAPGVYRDFGRIRYKDESLYDTRPFVSAISSGNSLSFDTLRGSDGSTYLTAQNVNIRLLRADADRNPTTVGALAKQYAVAEGNTTFYFLLRDDIRFGKVVDGKAVDSGVLVSAEDVLYSFDRMRDIIPTPTNMAKGYVDQITDMAILTDLAELSTVKASGTNKTILEALNEGLDKPLTALATGRDDVDGSQGKYEVVKIQTAEPFPQFLINLCGTQCGIVCKEVVSEANKGITTENYDPSTMVMYGDPSTLRKTSPEFNNNMYFSGPYCVLHIDDYGIYLQRNPGFASGTDDEPQIKDVTLRIIPDSAASYNAFRNGELDEFTASALQAAELEDDSKYGIVSTGRLNCPSLFYFLNGNSKCADANLRKAIKWAINQDEYIAVLGNIHKPVGSLFVMLDTGYLPKQDLTKAKEFLDAYIKSTQQ